MITLLISRGEQFNSLKSKQCEITSKIYYKFAKMQPLLRRVFTANCNQTELSKQKKKKKKINKKLKTAFFVFFLKNKFDKNSNNLDLKCTIFPTTDKAANGG